MVMANIQNKIAYYQRVKQSLLTELEDISLAERISNYVHRPLGQYNDDQGNFYLLTAQGLPDGERVELDDEELLKRILTDPNRDPPINHRLLGLIWPEGFSHPPNPFQWKRLLKLLVIEGRMLYSQRLVGFILEPSITQMLKELVTLFYEHLVKFYRDASLSDYVGELARFMSDLIVTVEVVNEETAAQGGGNTEDKSQLFRFFELCERHQQTLYSLLHRIHVNDPQGLVWQILHWFHSFQRFLQQGVQPPLELQQLVEEQVKSAKELSVLLDDLEKFRKFRVGLKKQRRAKLRNKLTSQVGDEDEFCAESEPQFKMLPKMFVSFDQQIRERLK